MPLHYVSELSMLICQADSFPAVSGVCLKASEADRLLGAKQNGQVKLNIGQIASQVRVCCPTLRMPLLMRWRFAVGTSVSAGASYVTFACSSLSISRCRQMHSMAKQCGALQAREQIQTFACATARQSQVLELTACCCLPVVCPCLLPLAD